MLHLPSNYDNDKTKQKSFVHISQIVIEKLKRLLTARSLPKLEDPGSNSVIGNYNWTYLLFIEKTNITKKRPEMAIFKK